LIKTKSEVTQWHIRRQRQASVELRGMGQTDRRTDRHITALLRYKHHMRTRACTVLVQLSYY